MTLQVSVGEIRTMWNWMCVCCVCVGGGGDGGRRERERERKGKKIRVREGGEGGRKGGGGGGRKENAVYHVKGKINYMHVFHSHFHTASVMKEPWEDKVKRIQATSPYGHVPNWSILLMTVDL